MENNVQMGNSMGVTVESNLKKLRCTRSFHTPPGARVDMCLRVDNSCFHQFVASFCRASHTLALPPMEN